MKICIVGAGYVGLSLSVLLSQRYQVIALDVIEKKIKLINERKSPFVDIELERYLKNKKLYLNATINKDEAYSDSEFVIVATPTNYDIESGSFEKF